jgi:hypothetical protein
VSLPWRAKLDPRARAAIEDAAPAGPLDLLVALDRPVTPAVRQELENAGLTLLSDDGTVVAGRVPDRTALERVAAVEVVTRIELSRPLRGEGAEN